MNKLKRRSARYSSPCSFPRSLDPLARSRLRFPVVSRDASEILFPPSEARSLPRRYSRTHKRDEVLPGSRFFSGRRPRIDIRELEFCAELRLIFSTDYRFRWTCERARGREERGETWQRWRKRRRTRSTSP